MKPYVLRPAAQRDLDDIWDYTVSRWNADQADLYIRQIQRAIELIAADPRRGRRCDDIRAGYHKYLAGSHFIFYRVASGSLLEIVRILHQQMDFGQHLE